MKDEKLLKLIMVGAAIAAALSVLEFRNYTYTCSEYG